MGFKHDSFYSLLFVVAVKMPVQNNLLIDILSIVNKINRKNVILTYFLINLNLTQ